jgi:hypothetical protein
MTGDVELYNDTLPDDLESSPQNRTTVFGVCTTVSGLCLIISVLNIFDAVTALATNNTQINPTNEVNEPFDHPQ